MVPGLTMAETAVLVIFVLLLAMSVLMSRRSGRTQQAEQDARKFAMVGRALAKRGMQAGEFLDSLGTLESPRAHTQYRIGAS